MSDYQIIHDEYKCRFNFIRRIPIGFTYRFGDLSFTWEAKINIPRLISFITEIIIVYIFQYTYLIFVKRAFFNFLLETQKRSYWTHRRLLWSAFLKATLTHGTDQYPALMSPRHLRHFAYSKKTISHQKVLCLRFINGRKSFTLFSR